MKQNTGRWICYMYNNHYYPKHHKLITKICDKHVEHLIYWIIKINSFMTWALLIVLRKNWAGPHHTFITLKLKFWEIGYLAGCLMKMMITENCDYLYND